MRSEGKSEPEVREETDLLFGFKCFRYILNNPPRPLTEIDIWFQIGHVYEQQKDVSVPSCRRAPSALTSPLPDAMLLPAVHCCERVVRARLAGEPGTRKGFAAARWPVPSVAGTLLRSGDVGADLDQVARVGYVPAVKCADLIRAAQGLTRPLFLKIRTTRSRGTCSAAHT